MLLSTFVLVNFESSKNIVTASPHAYFYDAYYYLEDFDGDGYDDGMDVWFDVDIDTMDTVLVTVTARLIDNTTLTVVDQNSITYYTYYLDVDEYNLLIGPVSEDGWYYLELELLDELNPAEYLYSGDEYLYDAYKKWTIMVYLDGDNNLEPMAIDDFNEMEAAGGTTTNVNIVTLFDRCSYGYESGYYPEDWSGSRYYEVNYDTNMNTMASTMVQDLGEVNMGSQTTLYNFVDWAMQYYAADKYALILWDHGAGIPGACWDEDNGNDYLTLDEIYSALETFHLDFLGFDACLMSQTEILYQFKDICDVFGASMIEEPGDGWDYEAFLSGLISNPDMTAGDLGTIICDTYIDFFSDQEVTFGVYNVTQMPTFDFYFNAFTQSLIDNIGSYGNEIYQARLNSYGRGFREKCDLYRFVANLVSSSSSAIATAATNLITCLDNMLITADSTIYEDFYGLWIYFPAVRYDQEMQDYIDNIYNLRMNTYAIWDDFLAIWKIEVSNLTPTWDEVSVYHGSISAGNYIFIQADLAATLIDDTYFVSLGLEEDMYCSMSIWDEEKGFAYSSRMPEDIPETIGFICDSSERIYIYIYCSEGSGSFSLTFYDVDIVDDLLEDNDGFGEAASIDPNTTYLLFGMDSDYFSIELEAGDSVLIVLEFNFQNDYDLYIYDDSYFDVDWSAGYSHPEVVEFVADYTGTYYIEIDPFDVPYTPYYVLSTIVSDDGDYPVVGGISFTPSTPDDTDDITVTCTVTDANGSASVILSYNTTTGWVNVTMTNVGGDSYQGTIPAQAGASSIEFIIYAEDIYGHETTSSTIQIDVEEPVPTNPTKTISFSPAWLCLLSLLIIPIVFQKRKKQ